MGFMGMWWLWLIIIVPVAYMIIYLIRRSSASVDNIYKETPLDLLKMRYARGEIDEEEFEEKKKQLLN